MKTLVTYRCELCNSVYEEYQEAIDCEKSHVLPVSVEKPKFYEKVAYPYGITVVLSNGDRIEYVRK